MAQSPVIYALVQKIADITGEIRDAERQVARMRESLAHAHATLLLFDPEAKPESIKPKGTPPRASPYFDSGELTRLVLGTMRTAGEPISARHLTVQIMIAKQMDPNERRLLDDMVARIRSVLGDKRRMGLVEQTGKGWDTKWRIVAAE